MAARTGTLPPPTWLPPDPFPDRGAILRSAPFFPSRFWPVDLLIDVLLLLAAVVLLDRIAPLVRERLGRMLKSRADQPITELASDLGFASASHFSNRFRQALGATPGQYRQAFAAH